MHLETGLRHPWMQHFGDAYPAECQERLAGLKQRILKNRFDLEIKK